MRGWPSSLRVQCGGFEAPSGSNLTFESRTGFPPELDTCESGACEREFPLLSSPLRLCCQNCRYVGHRQVEQATLFYEFSLERHVPADHLLRAIDRFVELGELRRELVAFYSTMGRPSIDPELMIRVLVIGYCFGIRSERPP